MVSSTINTTLFVIFSLFSKIRFYLKLKKSIPSALNYHNGPLSYELFLKDPKQLNPAFHPERVDTSSMNH